MQERIEVISRPVDSLKPDPMNPRKNDAAVPAVRESIKTFGFRVPLVIDKEGNIVAGHTRYLAARDLGMEELPCIVADQLTKKQLKAFQLADNKTGEFARWDNALLTSELDDLAGLFEMSVFGFGSRPQPKNDKEDSEEDGFVICPRCGAKVPKTREGDELF